MALMWKIAKITGLLILGVFCALTTCIIGLFLFELYLRHYLHGQGGLPLRWRMFTHIYLGGVLGLSLLVIALFVYRAAVCWLGRRWSKATMVTCSVILTYALAYGSLMAWLHFVVDRRLQRECDECHQKAVMLPETPKAPTIEPGPY
jgi:hypothetical protein